MSPLSSSPELSLSRLALLLVLQLTIGLSVGACDDSVAAKFPTAPALPDGERRPDGVAVDLSSDPPPPVAEASAADKVVTLATPLSRDVALASVRTFFGGVEREDLGLMMQVLDPSALSHDTSTGSSEPLTNASSLWRQRFGKHDFLLLAARLVYRDNDITVYQGDAPEALPMVVRYLNPPPPMEPTDLVLRVPVVTHSVDGERMLGDELYFWLRREGDRFSIYRMAEDVPL